MAKDHSEDVTAGTMILFLCGAFYDAICIEIYL